MVPGITKRFSPDNFRNKVINRQGPLGDDACQIMYSAIKAVDPYRCVQEFVHLKEDSITIGDQKIPINNFERIIVIGFGKASALMAQGIIDIFKQKVAYAAVVTKDERFRSLAGYGDILNVYIGGHPIPSPSSIKATNSILSNLPKLTKKDLVFVLISGGGSALFTHPVPGISLDDLQSMTKQLLKCGAAIGEINTLRKHLDQVKGGKLALHLQPARIYSLILSDVIGNPLDMIASGPTVPDPTYFEDAYQIIKKYDLTDELPNSILDHIKKGIKGEIPETLKSEMMDGMKLHNQIIGSNFTAIKAAYNQAKSFGYQSLILSAHLTGNTAHVAEFLIGIIDSEVKHQVPSQKPLCLLLGGETTVTVTGDGLGGRNQDLALRMVRQLSGIKDLLFISLGTDGEDGPTDAAGGAVDGLMYEEGTDKYHLKISEYIRDNNSYHYLDRLGGLIKSGSTGTNVNDLVIILIKDA